MYLVESLHPPLHFLLINFVLAFILYFLPFSSQLYYWRESSLVPGLVFSKENKTKGFYSTMAEPSGIVTDLVPYSRYKMLMVVANNGYEGPPSNMVEFTTKEGGEDTEVLY